MKSVLNGNLRFRREGNPSRCKELLLLADESEEMVMRYLPRGELWVAECDDVLCAVAVLTDERHGVCELKNLAVAPACQRQGVGRRFVTFLCEHYAARFREMRVGTGETPRTLGFYRACGFRWPTASPTSSRNTTRTPSLRTESCCATWCFSTGRSRSGRRTLKGISAKIA